VLAKKAGGMVPPAFFLPAARFPRVGLDVTPETATLAPCLAPCRGGLNKNARWLSGRKPNSLAGMEETFQY
jgi:hypothetical protein